MGADNPNNNTALNKLIPDPKQKASAFAFSILYSLCIFIGFCASLFILQGLSIYLKSLERKESAV